jgi:hypothetical protein
MIDKLLDAPLEVGGSTPMLLVVLVALEAVLSWRFPKYSRIEVNYHYPHIPDFFEKKSGMYV